MSYHDDEHGPSLSASIAHLLCSASPAHAWTAHPRLNPNYEREHSERFDVGVAAHALLLEGVDKAVRLDWTEWRTNAAKAARDAARAAGQIPLLADQYDRVLEMVAAVNSQLAAFDVDPPLLVGGTAEVPLYWTHAGVKLRGLVDWLRSDVTAIDDLKTTSRSAHPQAYARNLYAHGGDIQAAFYLAGARAIFEGSDPVFRWIVCETTPPYAVSVITPAPDVLAVGESKMEYAIRRWGELLQDPGPDTQWPGYPLEVVRAELPAWEETRWLERMEAGL